MEPVVDRIRCNACYKCIKKVDVYVKVSKLKCIDVSYTTSGSVYMVYVVTGQYCVMRCVSHRFWQAWEVGQ